VSEGQAALELLARRKLRGFWRRQLRKARTPKGALLALFGVATFALWFASITLGAGGERIVVQVDQLAVLARFGLLTMTMLTISSAFSLRGLYLPSSEIEALFSAPLSRIALVRYRLRSALARSLFGAVFFGWMFARRAPEPWFAFAGAFCALMTLPLFGQALSLSLGDAENRLAARLSRLPWRTISLAVIAAAVGVFVLSVESANGASSFGSYEELFSFLSEHPFVRAIGLPFTPWIRAITALDARTFWPWFGACVAIFGSFWWGVPRIPVDYRELALETSADVARRLARARRGLAASSGSAGAGTRSWRTPWLAGRGPFGAAAWRKAVTIVRKSRASFLLGGVIVSLIAVFSVAAGERDADAALRGALMVAGFGTFYLCIGLRFDFREDLDLIGLLRSWPIAPWKLFLATLIPETMLVSGMIALGVGGLALFHGSLDPRLLLVVGAVPFAVLAWTAIDNATFLFAPVRIGAVNDGALQNAGRAMVLMLLRTLTLVLCGALACTPYIVLDSVLELPTFLSVSVGCLAGVAILCTEIAVLVFLGGEVLRRFDVPRDQP
jgi:hypothetical protein